MRWLYGFLCMLEKPLLADTQADLMDLLKEIKTYCKSDSQMEGGDTDNSSTMNQVKLIQCLIEEYFEQKTIAEY